jgi:hypothetical protein
MTYKERYYRDHKNDKKPLTTRLYEIAVTAVIAITAIIMFYCLLFMKYLYSDNPLLWFIVFVASDVVFVWFLDLRLRDDDDLQEELGIKKKEGKKN